MIRELLDRIFLLSTSTKNEMWGYDVKEVRGQIEQETATLKEQLAELEKASADLDYAEAVVDSFAGGPAADSSDSEGEGE